MIGLLLCFCSITLYGSNTIKGSVINQKTKEGIPYVNVGIFDKNIGTVTTENGEFELILNSQYLGEFVTFSSIGFKTKEIAVSELLKKETPVIIVLEEKETILDEVLISVRKKRKYKTRTLGIKRASSYYLGYIGGEKKAGAEIARKMHPRGRATIVSASVYVKNMDIEKKPYTLRLNVYDVDKEGNPGNILLSEPVYITSTRSDGWLRHTFKEKIVVEAPFYISYEWLTTGKATPFIALKGSLYTGDAIRTRSISLGKWKKERGFNFAIQSVVLK
ncbi:carboxypeptidase-like regulatory domain-containing protein [Aquimarina hainanensis]